MIIARKKLARPVSVLERASARTLAAPVALVVLLGLGGCAKKKEKPFPPAPQLTSAAAGAAVDGGSELVPVPVVPVAVTPPAPADTMKPADRVALTQAKATIDDLETMVKKRALTNPEKPEDGDATSRCAALEETHAQLEALADADAKKAVADTTRLCSLEVPILNADDALKQVTISPSQASHKLMCGFAAKDIDKARRASATDRRVRDLDARFGRSCR